jgi:hypothetical protein
MIAPQNIDFCQPGLVGYVLAHNWELTASGGIGGDLSGGAALDASGRLIIPTARQRLISVGQSCALRSHGLAVGYFYGRAA